MRGDRPCRRPARLERGQALVEYAIGSWLLIVALVLTATVRIVPGGEDGAERTVVEAFFEALQSYRDSVDFVLNLPVP